MVSDKSGRNCTLRKTIEFAVLAIILLSDSAFAVNTIWDEGSGSPLPFTWNYSNFDDFNINGTGTENLSIIQSSLGDADRTIRGIDDPGGSGLIYSTTRKMVEFEVSKKEGVTVYDALNSDGNKEYYSGNYYATVNLFGEQYIAIDGKSNKLSKLILEQKNNERVIISLGEIWDMGDGWTFMINAIDARASPRQVWFSLRKDGILVDDGIGQAPVNESIRDKQYAVYVNAKTILGQQNVPIFVTYIEDIFSGSKSEFVVLKHTWLISDNTTELFENDPIGNFILASSSPDGLTFGNNHSIVLKPNTTKNLAGNLNLKVIDNDTYLKFYPSFDPKLNITASQTDIPAGISANVTFSVIENGSGVFGANVMLRGAAIGSGITDANGQVTININTNTSNEGTIIAEATKAGYARNTTTLQVYQLPSDSIASWNLKENYVLNLTDIDTAAIPRQLRLQLIKNGIVVKDSIVQAGKTFKYCPGINCLFNATVDSIFSGDQGFVINFLNVSQRSESNGSNLSVDADHILKSLNFSGTGWQLDEGYELKLMDIDYNATPRLSYFEISKNNKTLDEFVLSPGQTYSYNNLTKILEIQVDQIFKGQQGHLVRLINVNQFSEKKGTALRNNESHLYKSANFTGMNWQLEDDYELRRMDIDTKAQPHVVWLELLKNNITLDDAFIQSGRMYYYNNSSGSIILTANIDGIFYGKKSNIVKLSEVNQLSDANGSILLENANHSFMFGSVNVSKDYWKNASKIILIRGTALNRSDPPYLKPDWDAQSFPGFFYDINKNIQTEELNLTDTLSYLESTRSIKKGHLWYNTTSLPVHFKVFENELLNVSGAAQYRLVGWQGEKWVAIKNSTNKIARLIFEMQKGERKIMAPGETWSLGAGYELIINEIDARTKPGQVRFTLKKDGVVVDEVKGQEGSSLDQKQKAVYAKTKTILGESDSLLFTIYINRIFSGATSDKVEFKYAWLIDADSAQEIISGDRVGVFEVRIANNEIIILSNEDALDLLRNNEIILMRNLKLRIADSDQLRLYPFVTYASPGTYEIRGQVFEEPSNGTVNHSWDARSFAGLYYDLDDNRQTEELNLKDFSVSNSSKINKRHLWYNTSKILVDFEAYKQEHVNVDGASKYKILGWQGEKWIAMRNATNKIAKLVLDMGRERKTLATGETWSLGAGYDLTINDIETRTSPRQVWFTLRKDGEIVDEAISSEKKVYYKVQTIMDESDSLLFTVYVDRMFSGSISDMVQFRYAWLIDPDSAQEIKTNDKFGVFNVRIANDNSINLSNSHTINLNRNEEKTLIGDLKIKVADSEKLRFYPKIDSEITSPSDTTLPVINSVILDNSSPITGNTILVTVKATDNTGVAGVKANRDSLTVQGGNTSTWSGTIIAKEGVHSVNVSAIDAAGNIAWNNSTSYVAATPPISGPFFLTANPLTVIISTPINVTFTVLYNSTPVSGATIILTGNAVGVGTTDSKGTVDINVNATGAGAIAATITKTGYENTTYSEILTAKMPGLP